MTLPVLTRASGLSEEDLRALADTRAVDAWTKLLPAETCQAAIREFNDFGSVGHEVATQQARVLLGSYPREPHDPQTFTAAMVQVLAEQPSGIGKLAIDRLTRRLKHYPTRADLVEEIERVKAERQAIVTRAKAQLVERERRAAEAEAEAKRKADRQALRDALGPAWDDWWGIPLARRYFGTPETFREGWDKASDKAAFCDAWGGGVAA